MLFHHQVYFFGVVATLLMVNVKKGYAVNCYSCSSKHNENCIEPHKNHLPLVHCNTKILDDTRKFAREISETYDKIFEVDSTNASRIDLNCLKVVIKDGNKNYILRGCQLAEQSSLDICKKIEEKNNSILTKTHCSRCNTDGCNSAPESQLFNAPLAIACILLCKVFNSL